MTIAVIFAGIYAAKRLYAGLHFTTDLHMEEWRRPEILISGVVAIVALLLSVSEVTQFMTLDETAFGEVLRNPLDRNIASNWAQGASHTANLIWVPITRGLQALSALPATIDASLKGVHWLLGMALIFCIIWNVQALLSWSLAERQLLALVLIGVLYVLPVDNLALKTLNYDLISLFGSTAAVLFVARGHAESNPKFFWIGLTVAALAAQEKLNASLILLVLCFVVGVIEGAASRSHPVTTAIISTLKAMVLALAVSLASYGLAAISLIGDPALSVLLRTLPLFMELLTVWIYAPLRFVFGIGDALADPAVRVWYAWVATALTLVLLPVVAALVVVARTRFVAGLTWFMRHSAFSFPAGLGVLLAAGVAGLYLVSPFFAPMVPLDPSMRVGSINGVQLHFSTVGPVAHRLAAVGFAYGVFIAAFPTALLVAAGATALRLAWRPRAAPFFDLMFAIALVTPGLLALMNTPTFNRYLNLPILWAAIVMVVRIVEVWMPVVRARRWARMAWPAIVVLMIAEVAPFRPLYAAFRPITVNYPGADAPAPGHLNFSWTGWGEETILAGKLIDDECRKQGQLAGVDCGKVGIWSVYNARWYPKPGVQVHQSGGGYVTGDAWPAGADTYYVINRQLVAGGLLQTLPEISPDFVVGYRGFAMAWVFRGDRLKSAGYRFVWPQ
ncbi:hypothetical protein LPB73_15890 [Tardiphaga sp. 37S4]|uniref:hypothetical protein n=1 Tax=Tardiphaga sp. 37S4 TaxID=1404741 RepID=UPI001E2CA0A5|nr:hypothetical protein [Tardiphaga sp. 37S4]UFS73428.1 hypothetical protein LPB73_15890 [Tardiphaga sp. 37S4]